MRITKKTTIISAGALALALVAGAATISATAAVQGNGSDGPLYVYNGNDGTALDTAGYMYGWNDSIVSSSDAVSPEVELACPAGTTSAYTFVTAVGSERSGINGWGAYADNSLTPTGGVNLANMSPIQQINGQQATLKAAGGTLSLGVACGTNNGVTIVASYYRTINVTAGTGSYTIERNSGGTATPPPAAGTTAEIGLAPTTIAAQEGLLSLVVPAGTVATFGTPTLVGNQSTVTGALGSVKVSDGRFNSLAGWTLSADVAEFTRQGDVTDTIAPSQLGVTPAIVSGTAGAVAGAAQTAGSATYASTFAELPAGLGWGDTVIDADLSFVAPQGKAAGTYNSVLTLTVVSK